MCTVTWEYIYKACIARCMYMMFIYSLHLGSSNFVFTECLSQHTQAPLSVWFVLAG